MSNGLFGVHAQALKVSSARIGLITQNISNSSTPGYKARDLDFVEAMKSGSKFNLATTHNNHININSNNQNVKFRNPLSPRADQNTVDENIEKAEFQGATTMYQTALEFIDSRAKTLKSAIRGQ